MAASLLAIALTSSVEARPVPEDTPLVTRWGKEVRAERVLPEYPRPQLERSVWINLNGLWDFGLAPRSSNLPQTDLSQKILVPFAVESALSRQKRPVGPGLEAVYRREISIPAAWKARRILLHFGAVNWECRVWLNGQSVGGHQGGYDPFTCDLTEHLSGDGPQQLVVTAWNPIERGPQPRGKQVSRPGGIWYTAVTGIWQTVWLEPVPVSHIERLKITPSVDDSSLQVEAEGSFDKATTTLEIETNHQTLAGPAGAPLRLVLSGPVKLWSPESPHLYDLKARLIQNGQRQDEVKSYFAMRKVGLGRDPRPVGGRGDNQVVGSPLKGEPQGQTRIFLNGHPYFQLGLLDQGWWPDGLYTAPTDAALRYDLEVTRKLGFNMIRKHVKVEPERWYYFCDRLGLLVWQDMPSGGPPAPWSPSGDYDQNELSRDPTARAIYRREWQAIVEHLYNHPSIVTWVPFNEGWGQHDTVDICHWTQTLDPTRLVDQASGGNDFGVGQIKDLHSYPGPDIPQPDPPDQSSRALVLGEFGGLGLPLPGHLWQPERSWGYRSFDSQEVWAGQFLALLERLGPLRDRGLSAAVYTQTTDVESEANGLMTYDREIIKIDPARVSAAARSLYRRS